jgi:TonB family protein
MKMEARESMSETWTKWQGYVINGVFPLGRYLGCSDHSGVFLTKSVTRPPSEVAIKLVPANRGLTESLLPRWKRAGGLAHPHLIRLLEWGGCQLDGLPYLYTVMEYADQTLAQLLLHRPLTDGEAREMLPPILDALLFLHGRKLVQAHLTPQNILVVGDQLKLASDTIHHFNEDTMSARSPSVYDAPEALRGNSSAPGDIWALGASLFEALTRRPPSGFGEWRNGVVPPADFSPAFREVVTRCLSPRPEDRPSVTELVAWASGRPTERAPVATIEPIVVVPAEPRRPEPRPPRPAPSQVALDAARPAPLTARPAERRPFFAVLLGAIVILALCWTGVRVLRAHHTAEAPPRRVRPSGGSLSQIPGAASHAAAKVPISAVSTTKPGGRNVATSPAAVDEVIPDVPRSARRTIHGHIKVWVRVIVDPDGSVFAAVADRAGPSRYFERLAIEAAKKWTFAPTDTPARRLMQVRFDFSRDGTKGRAITLH